MLDNKSLSGGQDRKRLIDEDYEVRDWAKKVGMSSDKLKQAVAAVGARADEVERYLERR